MANYPIWDIRQRHEWLATPLRKKRITRRTAKRCGLLATLERRNAKKKAAEAAVETPKDQETSSA